MSSFTTDIQLWHSDLSFLPFHSFVELFCLFSFGTREEVCCLKNWYIRLILFIYFDWPFSHGHIPVLQILNRILSCPVTSRAAVRWPSGSSGLLVPSPAPRAPRIRASSPGDATSWWNPAQGAPRVLCWNIRASVHQRWCRDVKGKTILYIQRTFSAVTECMLTGHITVRKASRDERQLNTLSNTRTRRWRQSVSPRNGYRSQFRHSTSCSSENARKHDPSEESTIERWGFTERENETEAQDKSFWQQKQYVCVHDNARAVNPSWKWSQLLLASKFETKSLDTVWRICWRNCMYQKANPVVQLDMGRETKRKSNVRFERRGKTLFGISSDNFASLSSWCTCSDVEGVQLRCCFLCIAGNSLHWQPLFWHKIESSRNLRESVIMYILLLRRKYECQLHSSREDRQKWFSLTARGRVFVLY